MLRAKISTWIRKWRLWLATRALMEQGMVIVNAEDWYTITDISQKMGLFIVKSGHINNGRKNDHARKKLRGYARPLLQAQQRFVHPIRGEDRMAPLVSEGQRRLEMMVTK